MSSKNTSQGLKKSIFHNFPYDFVRITGFIPAFIWLRPKRHRPYNTKTPRGAVLFSANHVAMSDPITMHITYWSRRMCSLATKNMFRNKLATKFFRLMHCISVDKDNFNFSVFREVTAHLEDGKGALIFPEGQINKENDMLAFKSGIVLMAYKTKAKILPTYIAPREKWYHRQHVVIGELIDVSAQLGSTPSMDDFQKLSEQLRAQEEALHNYYTTLKSNAKKKG